jgi:hypothetical protein
MPVGGFSPAVVRQFEAPVSYYGTLHNKLTASAAF